MNKNSQFGNSRKEKAEKTRSGRRPLGDLPPIRDLYSPITPSRPSYPHPLSRALPHPLPTGGRGHMEGQGDDFDDFPIPQDTLLSSGQVELDPSDPLPPPPPSPPSPPPAPNPLLPTPSLQELQHIIDVLKKDPKNFIDTIEGNQEQITQLVLNLHRLVNVCILLCYITHDSS